MALIRRFEERPIDARRIHGDVICGYRAMNINGQRILQLETYGSTDRQIPGKVSQSIQLDEDAACELVRVVRSAFPAI